MLMFALSSWFDLHAGDKKLIERSIQRLRHYGLCVIKHSKIANDYPGIMYIISIYSLSDKLAVKIRLYSRVGLRVHRDN